METTARLALPLLTPGQIQKEWFHNEALTLLDLLTGGSIEAGPITVPPPSPVAGALYLVGASGTSGVFAGKENQLAGWTEGGWRFVAPVEGIRLTSRASGTSIDYWNGAWRTGVVRADEVVIGGTKVVGSARPAIADPAGGVTVDAPTRACVVEILAALRSHGLIQT